MERIKKANYQWLTDPEVFAVNTVPAHSDHRVYASFSELKRKKSSLEQNLDGRWQVDYVENANLRPKNFYKNDFNDQSFAHINVPGNLELQGFGRPQYVNIQYPWDGSECLRPPEIPVEHNPVASYVRRFNLKPSLKGKTVTLVFNGVATAIYVWLNGHFVGYSEDSFTPAEFDVTAYLKSQNNRLCVAVFKYSSASWIEDQDFWRLSGIFRSVLLKGQPALHLADVRIHAQFDVVRQDGLLHLSTTLSGNVDDQDSLRLNLVNGQGESIDQHICPLKEKRLALTLTEKNVRPWSAECPNLYFLQLELMQGGKIQEVSQIQIGFRTFVLKNGIMYLNGKRIIFKGTNRHEFDCRRGRAITRDDIIWDLKTMKRNHINAVRISHYPNQSFFYDLCDRYGLYIIDETNLESHGTWAKVGHEDPSWNVPGNRQEWLPACLFRAKNMLRRDYNHPCVLIWSCGNESYAGTVITQMADFFRKEDPSRLVHYEGVTHNRTYADATDIESRMYAKPKEIITYLKSHPKKPYISCEYMHAMGNSVGGLQLYTALEKYPQYQGGFIWDFIDQGLLRNGQLRYGGDFDDRPTDYEFCGDGLVFANRQLSPKMAAVKALYNNVKFDLQGKRLIINNQNLFLGTNAYLFQPSILVNGKKSWQGQASILSVAPGKRAKFKLDFPDLELQKGQESVYQVKQFLRKKTAWAPAGYELGETQAVQNTGQRQFQPTGMPTTLVDDYNIGFKGSNFRLLFSRERGKFVSINYGGREMLQRLPEFTFWRALTDNDRGAGYGPKMAKWENAGKYANLKDLHFSKGNKSYHITAVFDLPVELKDGLTVHYEIDRTGEISILVNFPGACQRGLLPAFGLNLALPKALKTFSYYGLGPSENYLDRLAGSYLSNYQGRVKENLTHYLRPQECGNRSGIRTFRLLDETGNGLEIKAQRQPLDVSALPVSAADLENANHLDELPTQHFTWLRILAAQMGVGGDDSWGAPVHRQFCLPATHPLRLAFTLKPFFAE